jgi:hypothetical protein
MFTLKIETDNAAFAFDNAAEEVARILRQAAERIATHTRSSEGPLFDMNGNRVGSYSFDLADDLEDRRFGRR